ncbi:MAG: LamG-like jellyroll fold domain-containing protein, partial [Verrucomicrobiota bacterium]
MVVFEKKTKLPLSPMRKANVNPLRVSSHNPNYPMNNQTPFGSYFKKWLLFLLCVAGISLSVRADFTNGLILYLPLNETNGTTAADATTNGHNATLFNFPVDDSQWTTGRVSGGLQCNTDFTGLQYTTIDDSTNGLNFAINPNPAFTLAAWVRGKVSSAQTNGSGIIARGYGRGGEQYAIDTFGSSFRFFVRDAVGAAFTIQQPAGPTNVANGTWQHVVGVFDSTLSTNRLKLYINGQLIGQTNGPTSLLDLAHDVSIGSREDSISSGYNLPFTGIMDEVRIYNRPLVPSDVQELYLAAGLVAPSIVVQPQSISRFVSENATFSVVADGTFPLFYQWKKDGANIPNATNSTLTITPLVLTNAGTYAVMVSNSVDFVVSSNAVLTVTQLATDDFSTGLIAWWKFDETSGNVAADSSGNSNNATLYQFPSDGSQWKTNGRLGGSLRFNVTGGDDGGDKNDYVWTDSPI